MRCDKRPTVATPIALSKMIEPLHLALFGDEPEAAATPAIALAALAQLRNIDNLYALVDAARDASIQPLVERSEARHQSLLNGELADKLASWSPYLVKLSDDALLESLLLQGWGKSWGIYFTAERSFAALRRHFARQLLIEHQGQQALFRFYDPRVLRTHLPSAEPEQQQRLFGDVACFFLEGEQPEQLLSYRIERERFFQQAENLAT